MAKKALLFFLLYLVFSLWNTYGQQYKVTGEVIHKKTKQPLAFVNIFVSGNLTLGTSTDIDGKFEITSSEKIETIQIRHIGFAPKTINVENKDYIKTSLRPTTDKLEEVVISTRANPAIPIIKKAIKHRQSNHPDNIPEYHYSSYNKVIFEYISQDKKADSVYKSILKDGYLMLMESVTKKNHKKPDLSEEVVIANRVSGFKNPAFMALATDVQPFSFYDQNIDLLDMRFLNPISSGATRKYQYELKETLPQKKDTIHLITFKPLPGKFFDGLEGTLYINTNNYAIQKVLATPADKNMKIKINIRQQYQYTNQKHWFPEQLNFELIIDHYIKKGQRLRVNGKSYIDSVNFFSKLKKTDFSAIATRIDDDASSVDSLHWKIYRKEPLTAKEKRTYKVVDSLGNRYKVDNLMRLFSKLPEGKMSLKYVDVDLTKTLVYNIHEGFRLGTGLYTNKDLLKNFSFGGFLGYGLKDYEWKYGFGAKYTFSEDNDFFVEVDYENNIKEIGSYGLPTSKKNIWKFQKFYHFKSRSYSTIPYSYRI